MAARKPMLINLCISYYTQFLKNDQTNSYGLQFRHGEYPALKASFLEENRISSAAVLVLTDEQEGR